MTSRRVVVPDVDTALLLAVIEQIDDVIREVSIIQIGVMGGMDETGVPDEVLAVFGSVRDVVYAPKEEISRQAAAAWEAGRPRLDVEIHIDDQAGSVVRSVLEAFERVDAVSGTDRALLIPAASEEVAGYRRWFLNQLADRVDALI